MKKLLILLALAVSVFASEAQVNHVVQYYGFTSTNSGGNRAPTLVHFPASYNPAKKHPLIVFLHGAGESGNLNGSQVSKIYNSAGAGGPAYYIERNQWPDSFLVNGTYFAPIVISPQAPGWSYNGDQTAWIIRHFSNANSVDTNRIYVTGLSAGGEGTERFASRTLYSTSGEFNFASLKAAAIVPMSQASAPVNTAALNRYISYNIPLWGFGSVAADVAGAHTQNFVNSVNAVNTGTGRFTNYAGGHCCWNNFYLPTYRENIGGTNRSIYEWMFLYTRASSTPPTNQIPKVNAGENQTLISPTSSTTLTAVGTDDDGSIVSYSWQKLNGPSGGTTSGTTASITISSLVVGTYNYRVTVTDNLGAVGYDEINVTVTSNSGPSAEAGPNKEVILPTNSVQLNGSGIDPENGPLVYAWTQLAGGPNTATFSSTSVPQPTVSNLILGTYTFRLSVTDDQPQTQTDDVIVEVKNTATPSTSILEEVATTEYLTVWRYGDTAWQYFFNGAPVNKVQLTAQNYGGKKVRGMSVGFNIVIAVDEEGSVYEQTYRTNLTPVKVVSDTTGSATNAVPTSIRGYFFTYTYIRASDSAIMYWGGDDYNLFAGSSKITKPIQLSPAGMKFAEVAMGSMIVARTTDGRVYEWRKNGSITPTQKTLPRPAVAIWAGHWDQAGALVPDVTGSQTMGYPYAWGNNYQIWGGATASSTPVALKTLWQLTVPIKIIKSNQSSIAYIDSLGRLFTIGDNPNGELGNGDEYANKLEGNPLPYNWSWGLGLRLSGAPPKQIAVGKFFDNLWTSNTYTFYWWARERTTNKAFFWGRVKSFSDGSGRATNVESTYPNALDVLVPSERDPRTANQAVTINWVLPTLNAGADQNVATSTVNLAATGTPATTYTIVGWQWRLLNGPNAPTIATPTAQNTAVTGLVTGVYNFSVQMIDNNGGTKSDTVRVTANTSNISPQLEISGYSGPISLPNNSIVLTATAVDPDGSIVSYLWTKLTGPSGGTIATPTNPTTIISGLVDGEYSFRMTVRDNSNAVVSKEITVLVNPANSLILITGGKKLVLKIN